MLKEALKESLRELVVKCLNELTNDLLLICILWPCDFAFLIK